MDRDIIEKKKENVLESLIAQETKELDWIEETEMTDTERETKLRTSKS